MEIRRRVAGEGSSNGMEESTMAILDTSGFNQSKISHHLNDDRLAFLEAVRNASLLPDNGSAPTRRMFDAIFHILNDVDSLDLIMESYQLLVELDKRFPRVYLSSGEQSESPSPSNELSKLVMIEEAWLPFSFSLDNYNEKEEANKHSRESVSPLGFHSLIQEIDQVGQAQMSGTADIMFLKNMLILQYLIFVLERDFSPRNCVFQENVNWTFLRESVLNMLLGSRKIVYKSLIKDCLSLICVLSKQSEEISDHKISSIELSQETNTAVALALPEVKVSMCSAVKKLFLMIIELDSARAIADMQGLTTRADGVRTPIVEIILDELIYDNDILYSFLQVFDEPTQKLNIIVQYFKKYIPKSSVQTRRSSGTVNYETFDGILKYLSNSNSTKSIIKKISTEVVQLLLACGFQAYLVLANRKGSKDTESSSLVEVCKDVLSAFTCLKREDRVCEILRFSRESLFTAATILSTKL